MTGSIYSTEEMLARLIAFDTTSRDGNIPLIEFVEDYLDSWGVPHFRVDYEANKKTNLFATIGPDVAGGIVLSGHTDVVPVDGQPWTSNPFELTERGERLFGRGTCDMKGFLAICLAEVPNFLKAGLKSPIHLALSCDEEVGCKGVRPLLAHMRDHLPKPRAVIVGEPTSMKVVNAHKSAVTFSTEVTGHEAHSSLTHHGVNAILVAGELLSEISRRAIRPTASIRPIPPFTWASSRAAPPRTSFRAAAPSSGRRACSPPRTPPMFPTASRNSRAAWSRRCARWPPTRASPPKP